ncbi:MAG: PAS domain-containing protein [Pseudomonadota bacterium]
MKMTSPVQERRLNMRLMGYWQELRAGASCPTAARFDPSDIADVWDHCFSLSQSDKGKDWVFRHIGPALAKESGLKCDYATSSQIPSGSLLHHMLQRLSVFDEGLQPIVNSGAFKTAEGRDCLYRAILLPFVGGSAKVELVVGGARCKPVPD